MAGFQVSNLRGQPPVADKESQQTTKATPQDNDVSHLGFVGNEASDAHMPKAMSNSSFFKAGSADVESGPRDGFQARELSQLPAGCAQSNGVQDLDGHVPTFATSLKGVSLVPADQNDAHIPVFATTLGGVSVAADKAQDPDAYHPEFAISVAGLSLVRANPPHNGYTPTYLTGLNGGFVSQAEAAAAQEQARLQMDEAA